LNIATQIDLSWGKIPHLYLEHVKHALKQGFKIKN